MPVTSALEDIESPKALSANSCVEEILLPNRLISGEQVAPLFESEVR